MRDKVLPGEPGEAFGVRAYSAAFLLTSVLPSEAAPLANQERRNTRALQTLRDLRHAGKYFRLPLFTRPRCEPRTARGLPEASPIRRLPLPASKLSARGCAL